MLAKFYIHRLSNDVNIAIRKNHIGGQIVYRSSDPSKTRHQYNNFYILFYKSVQNKSGQNVVISPRSIDQPIYQIPDLSH